ncbi:unnamed protein product [Prorocentrum cordatum]|nr:unnamed protein product [Polarella glacialis]
MWQRRLAEEELKAHRKDEKRERKAQKALRAAAAPRVPASDAASLSLRPQALSQTIAATSDPMVKRVLETQQAVLAAQKPTETQVTADEAVRKAEARENECARTLAQAEFNEQVAIKALANASGLQVQAQGEGKVGRDQASNGECFRVEVDEAFFASTKELECEESEQKEFAELEKQLRDVQSVMATRSAEVKDWVERTKAMKAAIQDRMQKKRAKQLSDAKLAGTEAAKQVAAATVAAAASWHCSEYSHVLGLFNIGDSNDYWSAHRCEFFAGVWHSVSWCDRWHEFWYDPDFSIDEICAAFANMREWARIQGLAPIDGDEVVGAGIQLAPKSVILCDAMNDSKHISKVLRKFEVGISKSNMCLRCKQAPEDMRHRAWQCSANKDSKAHADSYKLVPAALTQGDSEGAQGARAARAMLEAARGAVLATHAAAGLAGGQREAVRLIRAAEGLLRTAVAVLATPRAPAPPQPAADAPPAAPRRRRRPRGRGARAGDGSKTETVEEGLMVDDAAEGAAASAEPMMLDDAWADELPAQRGRPPNSTGRSKGKDKDKDLGKSDENEDYTMERAEEFQLLLDRFRELAFKGKGKGKHGPPVLLRVMTVP